MRWKFILSLERTSFPNLPDNEEDFDDYDFELHEALELLPEAAFLDALERAQWA